MVALKPRLFFLLPSFLTLDGVLSPTTQLSAVNPHSNCTCTSLSLHEGSSVKTCMCVENSSPSIKTRSLQWQWPEVLEVRTLFEPSYTTVTWKGKVQPLHRWSVAQLAARDTRYVPRHDKKVSSITLFLFDLRERCLYLMDLRMIGSRRRHLYTGKGSVSANIASRWDWHRADGGPVPSCIGLQWPTLSGLRNLCNVQPEGNCQWNIWSTQQEAVEYLVLNARRTEMFAQ